MHEQEPATSEPFRRRVLATETPLGMFMFNAAPVTAEAYAMSGKAAGVFVSEPEDVGGYTAKVRTFFAIASETSILDDVAHEALRATRRAAIGAAAPEVV